MSREVNIYDPECDLTYSLQLSIEDADRATHDLSFATQLLQYAKVRPAEALETQNIQGGTSTMSPDYVSEDNDLTENVTEASTSSNFKCIWSYDATLCLISVMETFLEDLKHPKKSKHAYDNVSEALISNNFNFNAEQCHQKWKSLVRSYKKVIDTKTKTGRGASRFMFFDQIDALLGDTPIISSDHVLASEVGQDIIPHNENIQLADNSSKPSTSAAPAVSGKRKRKSQYTVQETWLEFKKSESEAKMQRFTQVMELERQRLQLDERKINILEKIYEKL